jgi:MFS family permease
MVSGEHKRIGAVQEWCQHGIIMPACVLGMLLTAIHVYSIGVMIVPLEQEFGWSRAQISAGPLITSVLALILAPFAGRALDRYGPRRIALIGVPLFSIAISLFATAGPSIYSWLALYALFAVALVCVFPTVWTGAIAMRFDKSRGLAMAIALSGTGVASALVPFLTLRLIEEFGWRGAYLGIGAISFIVIFPLIYFTFDRDRSIYGKMDRERAEAKASGTSVGYRSPRFIRLAIAAMVYSLSTTGIAVNAVPILAQEGFTLRNAAEIAGLVGLGSIAGRILGGILLDLINGRIVATGCGFAAILAAGTLLMTDQSVLAASAACFLLGLASGAEFDACAYLTTRYFPRRNFGALFGVIGALASVGAGFSPMICNAVYDATGSYDLVLIGILPLFGISSLLFLSLGKYPDKQPE